MIHLITALSFSPTGNTEYVTGLIAERIAKRLDVTWKTDSITLPENRKVHREFSPNHLLVIGVPTYAGRVPNKLLPFIKTGFTGNGAFAIPVVTFGNRNFDDSLKELCLEMDENGFLLLGAAGVVTEHVFSHKLAKGRPDLQDKKDILSFADVCVDKILNGKITSIDFYKESPVRPYYKPLGTDGKPAVFLKAKPLTAEDRCTNCGICAKNCPMGSIDKKHSAIVSGICIKCQSCVKKCPEQAKFFDDAAFLSHVKMLEDNYIRKAENVFYIL